MNLGEDKEPVKQKPQTVPLVARWMIAHALGQRIGSCNHETAHKDLSVSGVNIQLKDKVVSDLSVEDFQETLHFGTCITWGSTSQLSRVMQLHCGEHCTHSFR
ncbi:hypothetical protein PanWU01x14_249550 [Parasponia andersonii]|uniref:Uncharacterized protein n=1 Tax=Parasponia andersonii TaxID=3476 RepID=A0A2P5BCX9_PARAD|nr:hypothetical protein PanWU01x14_249550 [Parasponia andersonii]